MPWKTFSPAKILILFMLLLGLGGCGKENVYEALSEKDTNEILVTLQQYGIEAQKVRVAGSQSTSFSVQVAKDKMQQARKILVDNNLPKKAHQGLVDVCGGGGTLIATPEQERCKKALAKKGDIINSLEKIPGIIEADIVLNLPENKEFANPDEIKKPTASAVIRVRKGAISDELTEARLQQFIATSVENLDPRSVSVIIDYVDMPIKTGTPNNPVTPPNTGAAPNLAAGGKLMPIAGLVMTPESAKKFKIYAVVILVVLLGISAGLILNILKMTKMRQELKVLKSQGLSPNNATADAPAIEEGSKAPQLPSGEGKV